MRCLVQDAVDTSAVSTRLYALSSNLPYFFKHIITLCVLISFLALTCVLKKIIKNLIDFILSVHFVSVGGGVCVCVCVCVCVYVRQVLLGT